MAVWEIIVLVVVLLAVVLFLGGLVANRRRRERGDHALTRQIAEADAALAGARAEDRGWDPALLEQVARQAFADRHPGAQITALHLVQVIDRPGTDDDVALMRVVHADGTVEIELCRTGDTWHA